MIIVYVNIVSSSDKSIRNASWISLGDEEVVEAWSHPSIYPFLPMYLIGIFVSIIGFFLPFLIDLGGSEWFGLVLIPLGLTLVGVEYLRYITVFYVFTDTRIMKKRGILTHRVEKVPYRSIDNLDKTYPIQGRILGYGTLAVTTASPEDEDIRMEFLPQLNKATEIIGDYRSDARPDKD